MRITCKHMGITCETHVIFMCFFRKGTSLIAFSGLNLLARFNRPKNVHTKRKLINKLGIFLYFTHRYSTRRGNCPNSQRNIETNIPQITTKIHVYGFMNIFTSYQLQKSFILRGNSMSIHPGGRTIPLQFF